MYNELIKNLRAVNEYDTGYAKLIYDAADAIEEMNKCIDGIEADNESLCKQIEELSKPRWIPVTEQLPVPYIGEWLCYTKEGDILILPYEVPGRAYKECMFYSFDDDDGYFCTKHNVTHWMPLPEPPKEET